MYALAAAQWILWYGQELFERVLYPEEMTVLDEQYWRPGKPYHGGSALSLERWRFWRDRFRAGADQKVKGQLAEESRGVCAKARDLMDAFERAIVL